MATPRQTDELGKALGRVIAAQRLNAGMSQEALSRKAGTHLTYISQLERGIKSPTVRVLTDIAEALGVRAADLLRMTDQELASPTLDTVKRKAPRSDSTSA